MRILIRWRKHDPGEGKSVWTKVHVTDAGGFDTLCGLPVPMAPYMEDRGATCVPSTAPRCVTCARKQLEKT